MSASLDNASKIPLSVEFFDGPNGTGNAVPAPGPIAWTVADPTIGTIDVPDSPTPFFVAVADGTTAVTMTCAGITAVLDVTVTDVVAVPGAAVSAVITAGPAVPK